MNPKEISIKEYDYDLPEQRIARYPLPERDESKLLIYDNGVISEDICKNIDTCLLPDSLLLFNDTKVIEARILFQKPTGGVIEIFCLEPHEQYKDVTSAMTQEGKVLWKCLVGGASKWKKGQVLEKEINSPDKQVTLRGIYIEKRKDHFIIELSWSPPRMSFAEVLHFAGAVPLPPYIKREPEDSDRNRYQTIYADHDGSVAAPTAGLHFTESIFNKLMQKNIQTDFITLHVGAGTFKPVKTETIGDHEMHAEFIEISGTTIQNILANLSNDIIAVGTTSLRTVESLYWLGVKSILAPGSDELCLGQWEIYDLPNEKISVNEALQSLLSWMRQHSLDKLMTRTRVIIVPGYRAKIVDGLITNFHQPHSTLLLLVAAMIGEDWRKVYDYALRHNFRFLSYGDGSLLRLRKG